MSPITSTIWEMEPHTKAKHEILKDYLNAWFPILSKWSGRIIYLDGFAGPGIYSQGEDGSPVIAISTAVRHVLAKRFREIIFWFIEKEPDRAQKLNEVLKDRFPVLPGNWKYEVEGAAFAPTLESVLDAIEKEESKLAPTFAFIDPFGFSGLPIRLISRMLAYDKCEVLITFMAGFVRRFTDDLRADALDELYATSKWRDVRKVSGPEERARYLVDLYSEQLKQVAGAKFVRTFEMRGKNNEIIYYLVFGTKHWMGLKAMKEAMYAVDRRGTYRFSDRTDPRQNSLLDYVDEPTWVAAASRMIFEKFKGKKILSEDIEKFVIIETPYVFRKSQLKRLEGMTPPKILTVFPRKRQLTYHDPCLITFAN